MTVALAMGCAGLALYVLLELLRQVCCTKNSQSADAHRAHMHAMQAGMGLMHAYGQPPQGGYGFRAVAPYGALGGFAGPQAVADQFLAPQDARYHVREQRGLAEHESERGAVGMMPLMPLQPHQPQVHEQKERGSLGREEAPITGRISGSGVPRQFM